MFQKINFWSKEQIFKCLTDDINHLYKKYDLETIKKINNVYKCISENLSFYKIKNEYNFFDEVYDTLVDLSGIENGIKSEHILNKKWRI